MTTDSISAFGAASCAAGRCVAAARRRSRLWGAALAATVIAGMSLTAPSAEAAFPGTNGPIAFARLVPTFSGALSSQSEIFTMNPDGTLQLNRTNHASNDREPAFSADGSRIAFVSDRDGDDEIYTMNADGTGTPLQLTNTPTVNGSSDDDGSPAFSRDGTKIAFVSYRDSTPSIVSASIYTMDAVDRNGDGKGDNLRRLTNGIQDFAPTFSPDGTKIAFQTLVDGNFEIYTIDAGDGSGRTRITNNSVQDTRPAWSPDGTKFAFARAIGTAKHDIYTMSADGTGAAQLTSHPAQDSSPEWSPDGGQIAFVTDRLEGANQVPSSEIYTMAASGAGQVNRTNLPTGEVAPDWGVLLGTAPPPPSPPAVTVDDLEVVEGDTGEGAEATFTLRLSKPAGKAVMVDFQTADGSAKAGADYVAGSGEVKFAASETEQRVTVKVEGDTLEEPDEQFYLNLSNPQGVTIARGQGTATIRDDDGLPGISVDDVSVIEGDADDVDATFRVALSAASGRPVAVDFATADDFPAPGSAKAGTDYVESSGTVSFAAGETQKVVTVKVKGDLIDEPDERFYLNLSNPRAATITSGKGIATIVDNDAPSELPRLAIGDVEVEEGDEGETVEASFRLSRAGDQSGEATVNLATADVTAKAGEDYLARGGSVTLAPNEPEKMVTVTVTGDALDEDDEQFHVNLSGARGAVIADGQGVGTIRDDDDPPTAAVADTSVTEGDAEDVIASFTVSLSAPSGRAVSFAYATADADARQGDDYEAKTGTVNFDRGQTRETVTVAVKGDLLDEDDEQFYLDLSSPQSATLAKARGTATIADNDPEPALSIDDQSVIEGDAGEVDAVFTVSLSAVSGRVVRVPLATADQSARAPDDYTQMAATVVFAPGDSRQAVAVKVRGDTEHEPDEQFLVNLSGAQNATLADGQAIGTIRDDDAPPSDRAPTSPPESTPPAKDAGCLRFRSGMGPRRLGAARLGISRKRHRAIFEGARLSSRAGIDRSCIAGGGSLGIGYPTKRLLRGLSRPERRRVKDRAVLVLTSSKRYSIKGVKPGASVRTLRRKLRGERAYRVGRARWYLASSGGGRLVFRIRSGRVVEIGIADKRLTRSPRSARRLLGAWRL